METALRTADGKVLMPAGFIGPTFGSLYISGSMLDPTRSPPLPCNPGDGKIKTTEGQIGLDEINCFYLIFDRTPYPDMDFNLSLEGIKDVGKPVSVPIINFKKASAWMFGMFP